MTEGERMDDATIEATLELRDDIDNILELAKQTRAPIRAVTLMEMARADLQTRLDAFELELRLKAGNDRPRQTTPANGLS